MSRIVILKMDLCFEGFKFVPFRSINSKEMRRVALQ